MAWRVRALLSHASSPSPDVNLTQRGIAVFHPNDMGRRRRLARDAPIDILRACWLAFHSGPARILPPITPFMQRLERED